MIDVDSSINLDEFNTDYGAGDLYIDSITIFHSGYGAEWGVSSVQSNPFSVVLGINLTLFNIVIALAIYREQIAMALQKVNEYGLTIGFYIRGRGLATAAG